MDIKKLSIAALLVGSVAISADEPTPIVTPGGTKVQLYGRLELNAAYEDDITSGLWSSNAPLGAKGDAQGRTSLSIARTRLGLNLSGPSKEGEPELNGRFEADFSGNNSFSNFSGGSISGSNSGFRVRQAYGAVKYKDIGLTILFGQTDDLITPLDPPSINPSSLNGAGNLGNRRPQIRVTQAVGPVEVAVAALQDRLDDDSKAASSPAVQGRVGLKIPATWAGEKANFALGIGGLYAKGETANADDKKRDKRPEPTYSFNVDLSLPIIDILTFTGEFFMGQNLKRYGDGSLRLYDAENGIGSVGWWSALAAKLPANFSAAAGVGGETLDDDTKKIIKDETIENNLFVFANVGYNFTSAAKVTLEYLTYQTDYKAVKDTRSLNRFEVNFRYDFR